MRIIPEWKEYDSEIKRLQLEIDEHTEEEVVPESSEKSKDCVGFLMKLLKEVYLIFFFFLQNHPLLNQKKLRNIQNCDM